MEFKLLNMKGSSSGTLTLSDDVFSRKVHPQTINDVVKAQLNNERQGTVFTKVRNEVRGGGRKPWRQKGTSRARQGSTRSPIWPGGACTFGPRPRIYDHRPPKKAVDRAIMGILSSMAAEDRIKVVAGLTFESGKTRDVRAFLTAIKAEKALIVVSEISELTRRATTNLKGLKIVTPMQVSPVDLLRYGTLAISDGAVKQLEEGLQK